MIFAFSHYLWCYSRVSVTTCKNQEHHFPSIEFKMVRKKAHHNEESCLNLLRFFQYKIYNVDCTARKIEVEGEELKIVLKL